MMSMMLYIKVVIHTENVSQYIIYIYAIVIAMIMNHGWTKFCITGKIVFVAEAFALCK